MNKKIKVRYIAATGMLSAVAFILQYIEIPLFFMPQYIKFDISDLPALIGAFAMGPLSGILISLIKNLLHLPFSGSAFVGEFSNFILGAVFSGTAGFIYKKKKTKKNAFIAGIIGSLVMGIMSFPSNLLIVYPVYYKLYMPEEVVLESYNALCGGAMGSVWQALLCFNVPFTIGKGLICVLVAMLIYKPLSIVIKGRK